MKKTLEDVNLSRITFSEDGRNISFAFADMYKGAVCAEILCESVCLFKYETSFEEDEGFPCYVGEVSIGKLDDQELLEELTANGYGFYVSEDPTCGTSQKKTYHPSWGQAYAIRMEGAVIIELICREFSLKNGSGSPENARK